MTLISQTPRGVKEPWQPRLGKDIFFGIIYNIGAFFVAGSGLYSNHVFDDMPMKQELDPIAENESRILILGSLPSDTSLEAQEYYSSPCNHDEPIGVDYESRLALLRKHRIASWTVLKAARV